MSDDISALLERLEAREAKLAGAIKANTLELAKVRATLASLRSLRSAGEIRPTRTRDVVRQYMDTIKPGDRLDPVTILEYADNHGWVSEALDRLGAIRTVLVRMHEAGIIDKGERAEYFRPRDD